MTTIQETFIKADETLNNVVAQIKDEQWDVQMPKSFIMNAAKSKTFTLRDVINCFGSKLFGITSRSGKVSTLRDFIK